MDSADEKFEVPADAGDHHAGLAAILQRIPRQWGKWIRVHKGWYSIIIDLNEKLEKIDPDYEVWQAKEKFGLLRYYYGPSSDSVDRDAMRTLVAAAEELSGRTCEECGSTGEDVHMNSDDRFYIQTLCRTCADSRSSGR